MVRHTLQILYILFKYFGVHTKIFRKYDLPFWNIMKEGLNHVVTSENATSMQQKLVLEKKDVSTFVDPFLFL